MAGMRPTQPSGPAHYHGAPAVTSSTAGGAYVPPVPGARGHRTRSGASNIIPTSYAAPAPPPSQGGGPAPVNPQAASVTQGAPPTGPAQYAAYSAGAGAVGQQYIPQQYGGRGPQLGVAQQGSGGYGYLANPFAYNPTPPAGQ